MEAVTQRVNRIKRTARRGFTLIEIVVTLCVLAIVLALGAMGLTRWTRHANFVHCEEYAQTTFLAMQNALADLKAQGRLDEDMESIPMSPVDLPYVNSSGREMGYLSVNAADYADYLEGKPLPKETKWLYDCLTQGITDDAVLAGTDGFFGSNANIIVEFDRTAQTVYSAFYATWASGLTYTQNGNTDSPRGEVSVNSTGNADSRTWVVREPLGLGYYSVDDYPHVAALEAKKLRINALELVNEEELYLRFSSNVAYAFENCATSNPVTYTIDLYDADSNSFLCHLVMDTSTLGFSDPTNSKGAAHLAVSFNSSMVGKSLWQEHSDQYQTMNFPLSVVGGEYRLVLDAMLDGEALWNWAKVSGDNGFLSPNVNEATFGIRRLLARTPAAGRQPDIYAKVRAFPNALSGTGTLPDYTASAEKRSNTENSLYNTVGNKEDGSVDVTLRKFRHLYNIRYYMWQSEEAEKPVRFTVVVNLDWNSGRQFLYHPEKKGDGAYSMTPGVAAPQAEGRQGNGYILSVGGREREDFPSLPLIRENWTLTGRNTNVSISNLRLGGGSVVDRTSGGIDNEAELLAMVLENHGTIQSLIFRAVTVSANAALLPKTEAEEEAQLLVYTLDGGELPKLRAASALCAVNRGNIEHICFSAVLPGAASSLKAAVGYTPAGPEDDTQEKKEAHYSGIGLAAAIVTDSGQVGNIWTNYQTVARVTTTVDGLIAAGVPALVPVTKPQNAAINAGIGGVAGFLTGTSDTSLGNGGKVLENGANITGNMQVGGIVGCMRLSDPVANQTYQQNKANLRGGKNTGLILCSSPVLKTLGKYTDAYGMFIGGIVGYGENAVISECVDQPTGKPEYTIPNARVLLEKDCRGTYVGGIVGYLTDGILDGCATRSGGFVLGHDYVGGIAGGLNGNNYSIYYASANKTTNACYVLGYNCVGGIVGSNSGSSVLRYCVNTGVVGGYGHNVGGIAGENLGEASYNGSPRIAIIRGCTSYTWDYTNALYTMASEYWDVDADNVGGLVGCNEYGLVEYKALPTRLQHENTVSAIVVGGSHVGGVIGLNGEHGDLAIATDVIKVIGGRIVGKGDCVGGVIGVNLSTKLFWRNRSETSRESVLNDSGQIEEQEVAVFAYADLLEERQIDTGEGTQTVLVPVVESFTAQPYGVSGRYCVGGVIGANLVAGVGYWDDRALQVAFRTNNSFGSINGVAAVGGVIGANLVAGVGDWDDRALQVAFRTNNSFGSINGVAAVGGVIGYQQSLSPEDCGDIQAELMRRSEEKNMTNAMGLILTHDEDTHLFTQMEESEPDVKVTVAPVETAPGAEEIMNNMTVNGENFLGGIVGMCAMDSQLLVTGCTNAGNVTAEPTRHFIELKAAFPDLWDREKDGVSQKGTAIGGIISLNPDRSVIKHCTNRGRVSVPADTSLMGGIVGVNEGIVTDCTVAQSQGNEEISFVGGIAGLNYYTGAEHAEPALIVDCRVEAGTSLTGKHYVGGIVALNGPKCTVESCAVGAVITADKDHAGGLAGENFGTVVVSDTVASPTITGEKYVGGLVGHHRLGVIRADYAHGQMPATSGATRISGSSHVGGLIGWMSGNKATAVTDPAKKAPGEGSSAVADTVELTGGDYRLVNRADVSAKSGYAGGVVGYVENGKQIAHADNYGKVEINDGLVGGITSCTAKGMTILDCGDHGSVVAYKGTAGGIVSENKAGAKIERCRVEPVDGATLEITGTTLHMGAVASVNSGSIQDCAVGRDGAGSILLTGGQTVGGIAGSNELNAKVENCQVYPNFCLNMEKLAADAVVGGVAGTNDGAITDCSVNKYFDGSNEQKKPTLSATEVNTSGAKGRYITSVTVKVGNKDAVGFAGVQHLGGIAGICGATGTVADCRYEGVIYADAFAAGNTCGGIVGTSQGKVTNCTADFSLVCKKGAATFGITDTAQEKREKSLCVGGIAGVNDGGRLENCFLDSSEEHYLHTKAALMGGIAGYNNGSMYHCGTALVNGRQWEDLKSYLDGCNPDPSRLEPGYGNWGDRDPADISEYTSGGYPIRMTMDTMGDLGGLAALNSPVAELTECITGRNWHLYHNLNNPDACAAGCIAYNEQTAPMEYVINQASLWKNQKQVAGGVICRQEVQTTDTWRVSHCYNFGEIRNNGSERAAGVIGCVKYYGGLVDDCHNYGDIIAKEISGGVIGGNFMLNMGSTLEVSNCTNHGSVTVTYIPSAGASTNNCAASGIYGSSKDSPATAETVLYNCANYGKITSLASQANGISYGRYNQYAFLSLYYCQNYGELDGAAGNFAIFGNKESAKAMEHNMSIVNANCSNWLAIPGRPMLGDGDFIGSNFVLDNTCLKIDDEAAMIIDDRFFRSNEAKVYAEKKNNNGVFELLTTASISTSGGTATSASAVFDGDRGFKNRLSFYTPSNDITTDRGVRVTVEVPFAIPLEVAKVDTYLYKKNRVHTYHLEYLSQNGEWTIFGKETSVAGNDDNTKAPQPSTVEAEPVMARGMRFVLTNIDSTETKQYLNLAEIEFYDGNGEMLRYNEPCYLRYWDQSEGNRYTYSAVKGGISQQVVGNMSPSDLFSGAYVQSNETRFYWNTIYTDNILLPPADIQVIQADGGFHVSWTPSEGAFGYNVELYELDENGKPVGDPIAVGSAYQTNEVSFVMGYVASGTRLAARVRAFGALIQSDWALSDGMTSQIMLATPKLQIIYRADDHQQVQAAIKPDLATLLAYRSYARAGVEFELHYEYDCTRPAPTEKNPNAVATPHEDNVFFTQADFAVNLDVDDLTWAQSFEGATWPVSYNCEQKVVRMYGATQTEGYTDSVKASAMTTILPPYSDRFRVTISTAPMLTGSTAEETVVSAAFKKTGAGDQYPTYRVELMAVDTAADNSKRETLVDYKQFTAVTDATTVSFTGLPEDMLLVPDGYEKRELKMRAWLAESGKGFVYFYDPEAEPDETGSVMYTAAAIRLTEEDQVGRYLEAPVPFTVLPAPVLMDNTGIVGTLNEAGNVLNYTFRWDEELPNAETNTYRVVIYEGNTDTVLYPDRGSYETVTGNSLTISTNDWTHREVRLQVTRVGVSGKTVGLTSRETYQARRRLLAPAQPGIALDNDRNELYYNITWSQKEAPTVMIEDPADPGNKIEVSLCVGYDVYVRYTEASGVVHVDHLEREIEEGSEEETTENQMTMENVKDQKPYTLRVNLEEYAGRTIAVYVVARAAGDSEFFVDSLEGEAINVMLPKRLPQPEYRLSWSFITAKWAEVPGTNGGPGLVDEEDYALTALQILATVKEDADNRLTGNYLLNGFVYDADGVPDLRDYTRENMTVAKAKAISEAMNGKNKDWKYGLSRLSPDERPYVMSLAENQPADAAEKRESDYLTTIQDLPISTAGRQALIFLRAATNTDISSWWTLPTLDQGAPSDVEYCIALPRVRLKIPEARVESAFLAEERQEAEKLEEELKAASCEVRDPNTGEKTAAKILSIERQSIGWDASELADAYVISLREQTYRVSHSDGVLYCVDESENRTDEDGVTTPVEEPEGQTHSVTREQTFELPTESEPVVHVYMPLESDEETGFVGLVGKYSNYYEVEGGRFELTIHMVGVLEMTVTWVGENTYQYSYRLHLPEIYGSASFENDGTRNVQAIQNTIKYAKLYSYVLPEHQDQYEQSKPQEITMED